MATPREDSTAVAVREALPEPVARRGLDEAQWRTLMGSLFPGAKSESVLMVVDYCRARKLDPLKKPCHIVPMRVKDAKTGEWSWRDVVMPGIYEYRTTAIRTGNYLGHSKAEYGPIEEQFGVSAPEWCEMTIYRRASSGERIEFPVRVYFREAVATKEDRESKRTVANERWSKAPIQMLTKCTEAAGLREAFPDEFGGEPTAEEMDGQGPSNYTDVALVQQPQRKSAVPPAESAATTASPSAEPSAEPTPKDVPALTLVSVEARESRTRPGTTFWVAKDSTGRTLLVTDPEVAETCRRCADGGIGVDLTTENQSGAPAPVITEVAPC